MLTVEDLERFTPGIFASGEALVEHPWFNNAKKKSEGGSLEEDGRSTLVKWVVVRGNYTDWAVYRSLDSNLEPADNLDGSTHLMASFALIARHGTKLMRDNEIRKLVPCTDEAMALYRF